MERVDAGRIDAGRHLRALGVRSIAPQPQAQTYFATPRDGIRGLRAVAPNAAILVVTGTDDDRLMLDLDLGIAGFAAKTSSGAVIEAALRLIDAGGRYLPPPLAEIAAARRDGTPAAAPPDVPAWSRTAPGAAGAAPPDLTDRQRDVLRLVARCLSNKEIAGQLNLAPETVKTHLARSQTVLGAKNRTDAATRGRDLL